ncbi:MAG: hypothetical protein ABFD08_15225 [Syntrophomonas sp.]
MQLNGAFQLHWFRYECETWGNSIGPRLSKPMHPVDFQQQYDLAEMYRLDSYTNGVQAAYLQFAGINEGNVEEIIKFTSKYGPLGIHIDKLKINPFGLLKYEEILEEIPLIQEHIKLMRSVINLSNLYTGQSTNITALTLELVNIVNILMAINNMGYSLFSVSEDSNLCILILDSVDNLNDKDMIPGIPRSSYNDRLLGSSGYTVTYIVNSFLSQVKSAVIPSKEHKFFGVSRPNNLLTAMYIMLYDDLIQGRMIKKCANKNCPEFFISTNKRRDYCCHECADAQGHREKREKQVQIKANEGTLRKRGRPKKSDN